MNILTHPDNVSYFRMITGREPVISEALDFENGGRYARADFGPIARGEIEEINGNNWEGEGYWIVNGVRVARLSWGLQVRFTAWPLKSQVIYSDTRPYDAQEIHETYGRLIELGNEHWDRVDDFYTHIKPDSVLFVFTELIHWGPDGYAAPGNLWAVYWDGKNDPVIQKIRKATHSDYPRDHSVHRARGHKCEICQ